MNIKIDSGHRTSAEAIAYLKKRFPAFKEETFRNAINLKNLRVSKRVKAGGGKTILIFSNEDLEDFARYYAGRLSRSKKGKDGVVEIPQAHEFTVSLTAEQIQRLLVFLSKI